MAVESNPGIVTSGLVFNYDMYNTDKSYDGEPNTNLITNPNDFTLATWTKTLVTATRDYNINAPTIQGSGDQRAYFIAESAGTNQHMLYQTPAATTGQVYSLSICAKAKERKQLMLTMNGEGYSVFDLSTGTIFQTGGNVCTMTPLGDGWYKCTATITKTNSTAGVFFGIWNSVASYAGVSGYGIYVSKFHYELKNYPTPYSNPSRSTTGAIINLVDPTQLITATSLTYASDNTFSFNGSTDYITGPSTVQFAASTDATIEAWVNRTSSANTYNMIAGRVLPYLGFYTPTNKFIFSTYINSVQVNTLSEVVPDTVGVYHHVVGTQEHNTGASTVTTTIYVDGVESGKVTTAGTFTNAYSANTFAVGIWYSSAVEAYKFSGSIPNAKVYYRALTASEVYQNFIAHRGRYGI